MLGHDARLAMRLMLTGTLLSPVMVPVSFWMADLSGTLPFALRTGAMLAGGVFLGLGMCRLLGSERLAAEARALDGVATALMLAFLLPVIDGLGARILSMPGLALELAALACALNFGGNLLLRTFARDRASTPSAASAGLVFGNRNVSVVLAALPGPTVALFVGLAQLPIYLTPVLLGFYDRLVSRCRLSSES